MPGSASWRPRKASTPMPAGGRASGMSRNGELRDAGGVSVTDLSELPKSVLDGISGESTAPGTGNNTAPGKDLPSRAIDPRFVWSNPMVGWCE